MSRPAHLPGAPGRAAAARGRVATLAALRLCWSARARVRCQSGARLQRGGSVEPRGAAAPSRTARGAMQSQRPVRRPVPCVPPREAALVAAAADSRACSVLINAIIYTAEIIQHSMLMQLLRPWPLSQFACHAAGAMRQLFWRFLPQRSFAKPISLASTDSVQMCPESSSKWIVPIWQLWRNAIAIL